LFGRKAPQFGYRTTRGLVNRGDPLRWGWSYNAANQRNELCWHGGKAPNSWHTPGTPETSVPSWIKGLWSIWP
jgi:hypothetical protein